MSYFHPLGLASQVLYESQVGMRFLFTVSDSESHADKQITKNDLWGQRVVSLLASCFVIFTI